MGDYRGALQVREEQPGYGVDEIARHYSVNLRWDDKLKRRAQQQVRTEFSKQHIREVAYRPFVNQHLYADQTFSQRPGQTRDIFPPPDGKNRTICVSGVGSTKPFSALIVDTMPDLHLVAFGQCFPRYRYEPDQQGPDGQGELYDAKGLKRIDNVTDAALLAFQTHYGDSAINKDGIFDYVYGILHAPDYRRRFANDLAKDLPRVPFAADFHAFADAGSALAAIHLDYETCQEYPLNVEFTQPGEPKPEHYRIGERAMKYADDEKTTPIVNDFIRLSGIPVAAHQYQVNGRTPLEWFIDRYRITRDKESGIVNDPNGWFDDPRDLIAAIRRIVHVSVETVHVVEHLPEAFESPNRGGILEALRRSPLVGANLDFTRSCEEGSEVVP